mgnify:CR=1 FL=1
MAVVKLTTANFDQEVLQADRPVLVDFYADWCGPCKMMGPVVEEISGELDDVKVCKINIDEEMEVAQRYGVMSIPTFIAFKNGEMTGKQGRRCSEGSACRSGKITKHSKGQINRLLVRNVHG